MHKGENDFPLDITMVSLNDAKEPPEWLKKMLAEIVGEDRAEEVARSQFGDALVDKFGITTEHTNISMIPMLPEPRTLITDLYIVDELPVLKKMDVEFHEFRLPE